jgi:hypothetical protein
MTTIATSAHFSAPPERVWSVLSDFEHAAGRIEAIRKIEILTPGPVGKGTRFRETRMMFKKEATEEMEITEWVPPRRYVLECESCGCHYRSAVSCTPEENGTRVEMSMEAKPLSFAAKILGALMGWMMAGACRKAFEKDLSDLKRHVEGGATAPAAA